MLLAEVDSRSRSIRGDREVEARARSAPRSRGLRSRGLRSHEAVAPSVPRPRIGEGEPPGDARASRGHERDRAEKWVLLAAAIFSCFAVLLVGLVGSAAWIPADPTGATVVQVRPGDTLPGLASEFAPGSDEGRVVQRIVELNDLHGGRLVPGPLVVPTDHP